MKTQVLVLPLVLLAAAGQARADETFDAMASRSVEVSGPEGLAALFWSQAASCKGDDDFLVRQCEGIKKARRERIAGSTFLVAADGALDVAPFNGKAMSVDVEVLACAACSGVTIGGEKKILVGRGAVKVVGGKVRPATLQSATRTFTNRADGAAWARDVSPRLGAQLLVRLPAALESWKEGGVEGYHVEVVGYRVFDRCKGDVFWAQPKSANVAPDQSACKAPKKKPTPAK